jgi:hypothetical protein
MSKLVFWMVDNQHLASVIYTTLNCAGPVRRSIALPSAAEKPPSVRVSFTLLPNYNTLTTTASGSVLTVFTPTNCLCNKFYCKTSIFEPFNVISFTWNFRASWND